MFKDIQNIREGGFPTKNDFAKISNKILYSVFDWLVVVMVMRKNKIDFQK